MYHVRKYNKTSTTILTKQIHLEFYHKHLKVHIIVLMY